MRLTSTIARGLKYISKHRVKRISVIANFLSTAHYDIVSLQGLFVSSDFEIILGASVSNHFPFVKLFHGYVVSELDCILTHRVPAVQSARDLLHSRGGCLSSPQLHRRILLMALLLT